MIDVELVGVEVELPGTPPSVVLEEIGQGGRQLSIFIGPAEAQAIQFAVQGITFPRPLTHDLLLDVLAAIGAKLVRVDITEIRDTTFFAELRLAVPSAPHPEVRVVSARPSDAVALAVRAGCPIGVADEVMDQAAVEPNTEVTNDPDEVVEEFRHFIDSVDPEDFAS